MEFKRAYEFMKLGYKAKLPEWGGYWYYNTKINSIIIYTKEGKILDFRKTEDFDFTINFTFRTDWIVFE